MLNITTLTTQWGKIFGGINEYNTFRGTTIYNRADDINAEFPDAAAQRVVVDTLYDRTLQTDSGLGAMVGYFIGMAQRDLAQACVDDNALPFSASESAILQKLIADMVAGGDSFTKPTVTIGGSTTATATGTTTLTGPPVGNGTIVTTVINGTTADIKPFPFVETIQFSCITDSYTTGVPKGEESFQVTSEVSRQTTDALWPGGSNLNGRITSDPTSESGIISNAYFDDWDQNDVNVPLDWTLSVFAPGSTLTRYSADYYSNDYCVAFNAAVINSVIYQPLSSLEGGRNYVVAFRYRRLTNITTGVIQMSLRDGSGNVIDDVAGNPLSYNQSVVGSSGATWNLAYAVFSVPRGYTGTPQVAFKFTTAMTAAETLLFDNVEVIPMTTLYPGGPDVALIPGNIGWAIGDTYTAAVANDANTDTFMRNIQRTYPNTAPNLAWPLSGSPTVSDALIS